MSQNRTTTLQPGWQSKTVAKKKKRKKEKENNKQKNTSFGAGQLFIPKYLHLISLGLIYKGGNNSGISIKLK